MLRFFSLLSIIIVIGFIFWNFLSQENQEEFLIDGQDFETFIVSAVERNTKDLRVFSFSISLEELFWYESQIYQNNLHQIHLRRQIQENFHAITSGQQLPSSIQKTEQDLQKEIERDRILLSQYDWNLQQRTVWGRNTWQTTSFNSQHDCRGIFFDPCIEILLPNSEAPIWSPLYDNISRYKKQNLFNTSNLREI